MKKKLVYILIMLIAILFLGLRTVCIKRCAHFPINRFPHILETIDDDDEQLEDWRDIKTIRFNSYMISGILEYSEFHFVTDQSLDGIITYLNDNGCKVVSEKEYAEYSAYVLDLTCDNGGIFFLTYYGQQGTSNYIVTFERLYRNSIKETINCCFSAQDCIGGNG